MSQKKSRSESADSYLQWRQTSLFEPHEQQETSIRATSNESESSTTPLTKSAAGGPNTSSAHAEHRPRLRLTEFVAVSRKGIPIGESSPHARYTDREIGFVFELREQGYPYRQIARIMDMPISTCFAIVHGKMRAQVVDRWKRRK